MSLGKCATKKRIWGRIIWKKGRADHVEGRSSELQRGISK